MDNLSVGSARWKRTEEYLLGKQSEIEKQLNILLQKDPGNDIIESLEDGFMAWQDSFRTNTAAARSSLEALSSKIKESLSKISLGTYGQCEKCGKFISTERLEAMPMAILCVLCANY